MAQVATSVVVQIGGADHDVSAMGASVDALFMHVELSPRGLIARVAPLRRFLI
jgi:hypothetical protein